MNSFEFIYNFGEFLQKITNLEKILGYKFHSKNLLFIALSHSSFVEELKINFKKINFTKIIAEKSMLKKENFTDTEIYKLLENNTFESNERLEFLGDALIGAIIADVLYKKIPSATEGILSQIRAKVVDKNSLADIALKLDLSSYLLVGKCLENASIYNQKTLLAAALEAIVGAVFLDSNFDTVYQLVIHLMQDDIEKAIEKIWLKKSYNENEHNYKGLLQHETMKKLKVMPEYVLEKVEGEPHNCKFYVSVHINNQVLGYGVHKTKKGAEQEAAKQALEKLHSLKNSN